MSDNESIMNAARETLYALVIAATDTAGSDWLDKAAAEVKDAAAPGEILLRLFPAARRRLGAGRLTTPEQNIETPDGRLRLGAWSPGDAGRAILLLDAFLQDGGTEIVTAVYHAGDEAERTSITRALSLLGHAAELKPLALQTGRINSSIMYAALALDNPFPSAHYSDHEFNQLVLKTLFTGLPIAAIISLAGRANTNLSRMCEDYFDERTAAGREVPPDIWLALAPCASERGLRLMNEHLQHKNPEHRYYVTQALENRDAGK